MRILNPTESCSDRLLGLFIGIQMFFGATAGLAQLVADPRNSVEGTAEDSHFESSPEHEIDSAACGLWDPHSSHVIAMWQRYIGRLPTTSELRRGVMVSLLGGAKTFDHYFFRVCVPAHTSHGSVHGGLSRRECINFDFAGEKPSARLKMRIERTSKENLKVLLQRAFFTLTYGTDPLSRGTATWVREQILLITGP